MYRMRGVVAIINLSCAKPFSLEGGGGQRPDEGEEAFMNLSFPPSPHPSPSRERGLNCLSRGRSTLIR
jgi:hypothetical protein